MLKTISGYAYILGNDINTDDIVPSHTLTLRDPHEMAKYTLETIDPNFAKNVAKGNIIIAGENFGSGSSREEAVNVLLILGVQAIVAKSFSRIYFRNAINSGLPALTANWTSNQFSKGDFLEISVDKGLIFNKTKNIKIEIPKLPPFLTVILESGGILNQLKQKLVKNK